jgi:hypothetical protein
MMLTSLLNLLLIFNSLKVCISQQKCEGYTDFLVNLNKNAPQFDAPAYTSEPIRVDTTTKPGIITVKISDADERDSRFRVTTNDTNFNVVQTDSNTFDVNFDGKLLYNINGAHRYPIELTVFDDGVPIRSSKALLIVPLINYNVNAPQYTAPVDISASITLPIGQQLGILNAYDIDGDNVLYSMSTDNSNEVKTTITVRQDGTLILNDKLTNFNSSFSFKVILDDDNSCCSNESPPITNRAEMIVNIIIIEVNTYSPKFIENTQDTNYCIVKFEAKENELFEIEIMAQDDDMRGDNGKIQIKEPIISDRSPQNLFKISEQFDQVGRTRRAIIRNLNEFDYENPRYGSNTLNIMFYAEDNGANKRSGYCFMSISIIDVNDNSPIFAQNTYTIYIHDQYKTRQFNYRFIATDADSGSNGEIEYFMNTTISDSLADRLFNLDVNGELSKLTLK